MGGPVKLNSSDLDANEYSLWDVAVFVWDVNDLIDHFCNAYLGYIGGQPNNNCKKHDMPLIAVVNRKGCWMQCMCMDGEASQRQCSKTGFLCCAKPGCPVIVCRRHAVSIHGTRMKCNCYVDSHGDLEESEVSDSNNESDLEKMDVVQLPDGLDAVLWESPQDEADSFGDGSMLEGNGKSIFVKVSVDQDLQCTDAYMVDDEIDPDDENVVNPPSELPSLFCTNAAHQVALIWCARTYISGYIVLNGVGSCLIWRNRPLHPRRYQSAFLERLVCTIANGTPFLL
jgi:hypothetical protein